MRSFLTRKSDLDLFSARMRSGANRRCISLLSGWKVSFESSSERLNPCSYDPDVSYLIQRGHQLIFSPSGMSPVLLVSSLYQVSHMDRTSRCTECASKLLAWQNSTIGPALSVRAAQPSLHKYSKQLYMDNSGYENHPGISHPLGILSQVAMI